MAKNAIMEDLKRKRKIIFSRKGMDSEYGKIVNPIMPDGLMLSLPIPREDDEKTFKEIIYKRQGYEKTLEKIIEELSYVKNKGINNKIKAMVAKGCCHPDPDINEFLRAQETNWRPAMGFTQGEKFKLIDCVRPGDIFLYYGTFKPTEESGGKLQYKSKYEEFHAIFGYLEVKEIVTEKENAERMKAEFPSHPHTAYIGNPEKRENTLFVSDKEASGIFKYAPELCLTARNRTKSVWDLQGFPEDAEIITGAKNDKKYKPVKEENQFIFESLPRGQEFIVTMPDEKSEKALIDWAKHVIEAGKIKKSD